MGQQKEHSMQVMPQSAIRIPQSAFRIPHSAFRGVAILQNLWYGRYSGIDFMKLYIKTYCGWCTEAVEWLQERGYEFEMIDVLRDEKAYTYMREISGQSLTPTLELENGQVLADFDVDQLEKFLRGCIKK